jgi:hypothetical protein
MTWCLIVPALLCLLMALLALIVTPPPLQSIRPDRLARGCVALALLALALALGGVALVIVQTAPTGG